MEYKDIDREIEKLRLKKAELTNKLSVVDDFDEKEELKFAVQRIQQQIDTLEKFRKKF